MKAMKRRTLLKTATIAGLGAVLAPRRSFAADVEIELSPAEAGAEISPNIYGHFIEHLGGVIYDGIWVGKNSKIANVGGIRKQFVDDMKQIGAPAIRWPGGCFADSYHWRDGMGSADKRPRTANFWNEMPPELHGAEPNSFGTHEFMQTCRLSGATPYLAANVGSGSPQEFHDWVSYCNAPAGTVTLADQRAANGDPAPFNVKYWGVGNESWGCGGLLKPAEYSTLYRRFTSQMPAFGETFLIACGPRGHSADYGVPWTEGFFEAMKGVMAPPRINGYSVHFYTDFRPTPVSSADSTVADWYAVLAKGLGLEKVLLSNWAVMQRYDPSGKIKMIVDEWGVWYSHNPTIAPGFQLAQMITLRDAVHTAMHFDIFNRHADKIAMANVAQTINCLHSLFLAHEDKYVRTPVFHVFDMYKTHMDGKIVPMKNTSGELTIEQSNGTSPLPAISSSASILEKQITVTLTNPSVDTARFLRLKIAGSLRPVEAQGRVLTNEAMNAANTFEKPDEVHPTRLAVDISGDVLRFTLPKKSIVALRVRLA
ncbi:MAG: alpha-L-arabinofuranosidase C-terminal domain-containing protein [Candidatus Acidiferrum sp.]